MSEEKIQQSLENFKKALDSLQQAVSKNSLSDLELSGAIQNFEFCFELCWKTLKKLAETQGRKVATPRNAFQYAFEAGFISDEALWLDMVDDRNQTVHTYNHDNAERVFKHVKERYYPALINLYLTLMKTK